MIRVKICELLKNREFISIATCDFHGKPNAASKFILRVDQQYIFLVDYIIGRTYHNLKVNNKASLSFFDTATLTGYQINGHVEVVEEGAAYEAFVEELHQKEVELSLQRIMEGLAKGKSHKAYEIASSIRSVFFKIKMEEVVEMGSSGVTQREHL